VRKIVDKYQLVTAATTLPVTLADAIEHLRINHTDHNSLITDLIWAAVKTFEKRANVCLSAQTWKGFLQKGYEEVELWKYPITAISSIQYYDDDNTLQTLSASYYVTNADSSTGMARPVVIWVEDVPSTYDREDAFVINFTAGLTTIDYDIKHALLSWVYRKYENPNDAVTERISFFDNVIADNRSYGL